MALKNINSKDTGYEWNSWKVQLLTFPGRKGLRLFRGLLEEQRWTDLEFKVTNALPFFEQYTDLDGMIDPWSEKGERWLASEASTWEVLLCPH